MLVSNVALEKYLPTSPDMGHSLIDSPFIKLEVIDKDNNLLNEVVENLNQEYDIITQVVMARSIEVETRPQQTVP